MILLGGSILFAASAHPSRGHLRRCCPVCPGQPPSCGTQAEDSDDYKIKMLRRLVQVRSETDPALVAAVQPGDDTGPLSSTSSLGEPHEIGNGDGRPPNQIVGLVVAEHCTTAAPPPSKRRCSRCSSPR